ncbi:hypothetical protein [Lichenicoccus sp.]|uniref:hypothetical protein n=1 Tax=Lichenicoccus sp. TaxID=2781899 RepID=UPI003D0A5DB1
MATDEGDPDMTLSSKMQRRGFRRPGAFEGRSWTGLNRHALTSRIASADLRHLWLQAAQRGKKSQIPTAPPEADAP